jgi:hypothetical protein
MNSQRFGVQIQRQFLLLCLMLFGLGVNSFAAPGDLDLSFDRFTVIRFISLVKTSLKQE